MLKNKTKEQLIDLVNELTEQVEKLENDVDYWQQEYSNMEEIKDDLEYQNKDLLMKGGIKDLENFIWRLKLDGFYFDKLGDFIEEYKKYYND